LLNEVGGGNSVSAPLTAPPPLEERIERAKELLEKKKEEKRKQDEKVSLFVIVCHVLMHLIVQQN
jgi:hypothetical protein